MRAILAHWRGEAGLARSFWVHFVLLRALVLLAQDRLSPPGAGLPLSVTVVSLVLVHGILLVWQVVGVLRAAERWVVGHGGMATLWGVQLACIIALLLSLSAASRGYQIATAPPPPAESLAQRMDRDRAARYRLEASPDGTRLVFRGEIVYGVARRFAALVAQTDHATALHLSGPGGNIYEARGLARRVAPLDTVAVGDCSSACTLVFLAGRERSLMAGARLGFHQYRVDASYDIPLADTASEQDRDRQAFLDAGVAPWFVERVFSHAPGDIWFPDTAALVEAGVVHSVIDPGNL